MEAAEALTREMTLMFEDNGGTTEPHFLLSFRNLLIFCLYGLTCWVKIKVKGKRWHGSGERMMDETPRGESRASLSWSWQAYKWLLA